MKVCEILFVVLWVFEKMFDRYMEIDCLDILLKLLKKKMEFLESIELRENYKILRLWMWVFCRYCGNI